MYADISGIFVKIAFADQVDILLDRNSPERPAARFNRRGQDALYLSMNETSARVAMQKSANAPAPPRVLVRYSIDTCQLIDLRQPDAGKLRQLSSQDWQVAVSNGLDPESWQVADRLRQANEIGLIDPSRKRPDLWHVTLFRWNEPGAPGVTMTGEPVKMSM